MEKDRETQYNGSYLYKLNEELSGQAELEPYFLSSAVPEEQDGYEDTNYTEPSGEEETLG